MTSIKSGITKMPVDELPLSNQSKEALQRNNFSNLEEVFRTCSSSMLLQLDGFDYHCLTEVYQLLSKYGLDDLLKEY